MRRRGLAVVVAFLSVLVARGAAASPTGLDVYRRACAACHGTDGRGAPVTQVGFALPLPDFTDCSFASREPDSDWGAIVREGGPARGFDRLMPAFGSALSDDEVRASLDHVRSFCRERGWPRGDLNLPRPLMTEKAFVEDEAVLVTTVATQRPSSVMNKLVFETRIASRGQFEAVVPFGFREMADETWRAGLGDVVLGTKWVLLSSLGTGSILSLAGEVVLPTGDPAKGLGKGVTFLEPFLAFGQVLPADAFLQVQAGAELSTEPEEARHEVFWRLATGITFQQGGFGRSWTPMLEAVGVWEAEEGASAQWDLVPGLQVSLSRRQHVLLAAGVMVPVERPMERRPHVVLYLLWDWYDGGLGEGW